LLTPGRLPCGG